MIAKILAFTARERAEFQERQLSASGGGTLIRSRYSLVSPGTELALWSGTHVGFSDPEISWCAYPIDAGYATVGEPADGGEPLIHYGPHGDIARLEEKTPFRAPLPAGIDPKEACFGRFTQIAYSSVAAATRPFKKVLVYGAGIVGSLAAQWFKAEGAERVGIADLSSRRLELAEGCGIEACFRPDDPAWERIFGADGPDTIVEATGSPRVVQEALERVARFGQVILLGSTRGTVELNVYKQIHRKVVSLSGAHETVLSGREEEVLARGLIGIREGRLKVAPMITHTIGPDELPGIYPHLRDEADDYIGVIVDWSAP